MRDKDARAMGTHFEASRPRRGQRKWPRMDRGGRDARVPLERLPILTMRVDCTAPGTDACPCGPAAAAHNLVPQAPSQIHPSAPKLHTAPAEASGEQDLNSHGDPARNRSTRSTGQCNSRRA
eukprot:6680475-Pyramimonas_sp.AAC.1